MDTVTQVQILDEAVWISHCANTFGKGMHTHILPHAMGKQTGLFNLGMETNLAKGKHRIQTDYST